MIATKCDICGERMVSRKAGPREPYHYRASGLDDVFLVGVEVRRCPIGHGETPVIPRIGELHRVIAVHLLEKPDLLTGTEVRYLRKFAGLQAQEFAALLRVTPETMSRIETGAQKMGATADKLVRAIAAAATGMKQTSEVVLAPVPERWKPMERVVLKPTSRGWGEAA